MVVVVARVAQACCTEGDQRGWRSLCNAHTPNGQACACSQRHLSESTCQIIHLLTSGYIRATSIFKIHNGMPTKCVILLIIHVSTVVGGEG